MNRLKLLVASFLMVTLVFSAFLIPEGFCALEDFTTYTEVDPNNHITVYNATHMKQHIVENEDCYLYKNYGTDAFSAGQVYKVDARVENLSGSPIGFCMMFSNTLDDRKDLVDNGKNYITIYLYANTGIRVQRCLNGFLTTDSYNVAILNKWWSFTLNWSSPISLHVYNNTARTAQYLEDTLTIPGTSLKFKYVYVTNLRNRGNVANFDLLVRNFELEFNDFEEPLFNLMGLNSTLNGSGIQLTINLTDVFALDTCLLEWNNTGTLTNTSLSMSGTSFLCLFNQTLNSTSGMRINYRFFFNDTMNNWGLTVQHFLYTNTKPIVVTGEGFLIMGVFFLVACFSLIGYWAYQRN